jgi:hypothetical protein
MLKTTRPKKATIEKVELPKSVPDPTYYNKYICTQAKFNRYTVCDNIATKMR